MIGIWYAASALVGILLLASLASVILGCFATRRHFKNTTAPALPDPVPRVSILKPVEGAGPNTHAALVSFCRLDYPGDVEIIIGTIRRDDPVVAVVQRLKTEFPRHKISLVFAELQGANRKTSIMEAMRREASGEFLFFSDADVAAPKDYLPQLVPRLAQPEVGCLTCLPRGVEARTVGGKMIALHYGFNYLPQWMLAQQTTGIHWAIGHTMAVPRAVLEKIGGFKNFLNHLADDYELGHRVSRLGLRVIVPPLLLDCVVPAESFSEAFTRMQRWKRTIRRSRGAQFPGLHGLRGILHVGLLILPLAFPAILSGLRIATLGSIALATLGGYVGGSGLGALLFTGFALQNHAMLVRGALGVVSIALLSELGFRSIERISRLRANE